MCCTKHLMLRETVPGVGSLWASREITRSALLLQLLITQFCSFLHLTSPVIITSPGLPSLTATMFQMFPMEEWFVSCEMTRVSSVLRCVSKIMHSIKSFPPDLHHTFVIDTGESSFFLFSKPFFVEEDFKNTKQIPTVLNFCDFCFRIDWKITKFIPDCSPVESSAGSCPAGWEARDGSCVACPPGMFRHQAAPLCQLCGKGTYSDSFGSASCQSCPQSHYTLSLGVRRREGCRKRHTRGTIEYCQNPPSIHQNTLSLKSSRTVVFPKPRLN